ncbi:hypothetical protein K9F62_11080 [Desulfovibrio sp. JY]|nr:hypothetical protein K9F62_11080 [Desulfovibrio sp. JY]
MLLHISSPTVKQVLAFHALYPDWPLNVLLSYAIEQHFQEFQELYRKNICSLILDSGAYTLNKSSWAKRPKDILRGYANFSEFSSKYYDFIFNLDEDFTLHGYDVNMFNQIELEEANLDPVPVVHNLDNDEPDRFIDLGYDLVAIGQCEGGRPFKKLKRVVNKFYENNIKVHLFGVTEIELLDKLPIWSCDSSSWAQYVKYGQVMWWNSELVDWNPMEVLYFPKRQVEHDASRGSNYWDYIYQEQFDHYIEKNLGLTVDHLLGSNKEYYRGLVNILFFKEMERYITERHENVHGFFFDE